MVEIRHRERTDADHAVHGENDPGAVKEWPRTLAIEGQGQTVEV